MNLDYDGLEQQQRIRKIASSNVTSEEISKMIQPYLDRRKIACEVYVNLPNSEFYLEAQELERLITYCNTQIKLILLLN